MADESKTGTGTPATGKTAAAARPDGRRRATPEGLVPRTIGHRFLLFWQVVIHAFIANRCPVRASALAYSNLLALVPVFAVVISVTSSLMKQEGEERISQFIQQVIATITPETKTAFGQLAKDPKVAEASKEIAIRIQEFIQNTRSGALGVTGVVALLAVGIGMLVRIENTFNDIWGITQGRTWVSRVVHYWAALTLGPLLLVAAIALTGSPYLETTKNVLAELPLGVGDSLRFFFRFLPFLILTGTFAAFYQLMPHTRIDWQASLVGGLVGGTLWQLNNLLSVFYASRVVSNSYVYGSLGLVPLVMVGLYFSWMILLFGAQVAYVFQNRRVYYQEKQLEHFNVAGREFVALRLMILAARAFQQGGVSPTTAQMAERLGVPTRLVSQIVHQLLEARMLSQVEQEEVGFVPAKPLGSITCFDILHALRVGTGEDPLEDTNPNLPAKSLRLELDRVRRSEMQVAGRLTLEELAALPD